MTRHRIDLTTIYLIQLQRNRATTTPGKYPQWYRYYRSQERQSKPAASFQELHDSVGLIMSNDQTADRATTTPDKYNQWYRYYLLEPGTTKRLLRASKSFVYATSGQWMASTSHHLFSFRRPDGAAPRLANARVTYLDYYSIFQFQRQLICTVEQRAGSSSTNRMFPANTGSRCLPV